MENDLQLLLAVCDRFTAGMASHDREAVNGVRARLHALKSKGTPGESNLADPKALQEATERGFKG